MVTPVDLKILPEVSAKLQWGGGGRGPHISQPLGSNGKKKALDVGGPSSIDYIAGGKFNRL
jgi:hypothetical protein